MSALFNQTNVAPGTSFSGGGSNFTEGLSVSASGSDIRYIQIDPSAYWSQPILAVENQANTATALAMPLMANPFVAFSWDGSNATSAKTGSYGPTSVIYQGNAGSGDNTVFLNVVDSNINGQTSVPFSLAGISSIQAGTYIGNAQKLMSSMIGLGYA